MAYYEPISTTKADKVDSYFALFPIKMEQRWNRQVLGIALVISCSFSDKRASLPIATSLLLHLNTSEILH